MKHVSPASPQLAEWAIGPRCEPAAEQSKPADPVALADLPRIVHQAFASAGWEVEVCWEPDEPEAAPDAPWDADTIDPADVSPCPKCGSYEQWQSLAGGWHCMACEPPHKSNLLQRKAARFRRLAGGQKVTP